MGGAAQYGDHNQQINHFHYGPPAEPRLAVSVAVPLGLRDPGRPLRGRDALLAALEGELSAGGGPVVLAGLGGCGKTSLALELAARRAGGARQVWWVDARSGSALEAGLQAVARQAGADPEQLAYGDTADVVWRCLNGLPEPWLLVVDNADDPALLDGPGRLAAGTGWVRPAGGRGAVLVTSRDHSPGTWGPTARLHRVRPLTGGLLDEAARALLDRAGPEAGAPEEARDLAERLGGLPLGLHLAGTYLAQTLRLPPAFRPAGVPTTFAGYRRAWADRPGGLDRERVLERAWAMSVELLEQRGHVRARALLELVAAFADADLPYALLLAPERLAAAGALGALGDLDGPGLWSHLTALCSFGLVDLPAPAPGDVPALRMHPLVRDTTRTGRDAAVAARLLVAATGPDVAGPPEDTAAWAAWRALTPHVLDAFRHASGLPVAERLALADAVQRAARHLYEAGLHEQARAGYEAVLTVRRELLGERNADTLTARHNLAFVLHDQGHYAQARAEHEAILAARRDLLGEGHVDTLITRHSLAGTLRRQGHLDAARAEYETVLVLARELLGERHPRTLITRHSLGLVLRAQGRPAAAEAEFRAVLAARRELLGERHIDTLAARHTLAAVLHDQGRLPEARAELEAVLADQRELLGAGHLDTLATRHTLAAVLHAQGDLPAARAEYRAVLAARREQLGASHPDTEQTRRQLAELDGQSNHP